MSETSESCLRCRRNIFTIKVIRRRAMPIEVHITCVTCGYEYEVL